MDDLLGGQVDAGQIREASQNGLGAPFIRFSYGRGGAADQRSISPVLAIWRALRRPFVTLSTAVE